MKSILNTIFFIILFVNISTVFSQEKTSYRLVETYTNAFFFNAIVFEGEILFGSDQGVVSINRQTINIENDNIIGPLQIVEGKIEKAQYIKFDNSFNYLLPDTSKKSFSSFIELNNRLYLINSGDLLVYEKKFYSLKIYPSIRSITQNYIGTYGGIFYKDSVKLDFPTFTNGSIREYDSITIINWGGLSLIKANEQENYYSYNTSKSGIEINDISYGEAIDSYELKHPHYYLSTAKGLYLFNADSKKIKLVRKTQNGPFHFISGEKNIYGLKILYLHDRKDIIEFEVEKNLFNTITNRNEIIDVFSNEQSKYYILTENRLEYFDRNTYRNNIRNTYRNNIILENLSNVNNVSMLKNFIILTSDQGLDLYDLNTKKLSKNILKDELNYNAILSEDNSIKLGGVNGMYEFSYNDLIFFNNKTKFEIPKEKKDYFLYFAFSILLLILVLIIVLLSRKNRDIKELLVKKDGDLNKKITAFIKLNIAHVSVSLLCEEFKLSVNELYNVLGNKKPGEIIRKERLKILKNMRRQKVPEELISRATGFSISYLKKI